jgi:hypothetical protein
MGFFERYQNITDIFGFYAGAHAIAFLKICVYMQIRIENIELDFEFIYFSSFLKSPRSKQSQADRTLFSRILISPHGLSATPAGYSDLRSTRS